MRTRSTPVVSAFAVTVAIILPMVFCSIAMADIVGSWYVAGPMKMKVKIKGYGSESVKETVEDIFDFEADGSFSTLDYDQGTWEQGKKKIEITMDPGELSLFFEEELEDLLLMETGYVVDVHNIAIEKNALYAKEKKNGSIKGKWKLRFNCLMDAEGVGTLDVRVSVKYYFKGIPDVAVTSSNGLRAWSETAYGERILSEAIGAHVIDHISEWIPKD
jgi:hypothetical protein